MGNLSFILIKVEQFFETYFIGVSCPSVQLFLIIRYIHFIKMIKHAFSHHSYLFIFTGKLMYICQQRLFWRRILPVVNPPHHN